MIGIKLDGNLNVPVPYIVYPGGEISINDRFVPIYTEDGPVNVFAKIESSNDFFSLALLKDILDRYGIKHIDLELSYVPYARQDRVIYGKGGNQALSIKVFANLLNSLNFSNVYIADPHSAVTPALINNCNVIDRKFLVSSLIENIKSCHDNIVLVAPDVGALKSVQEIAEHFKLDYTFAIKKRNPENGHLKIVDIPNIEILKDAYMLVLDDIADGGMTFNLLAQYIDRHPNSVPFRKTLYVTHGIFSKGLDEILKHYDEVITYNLFDAYSDLRKDIITKQINGLTSLYRK